MDKNIIIKTIDDLNIFVNIKGDDRNPPIIFVPGLMQTINAWNNQFDDPELCENFFLIRYDPRGHGKSSKTKSYTSELLSKDLNTIIEYFNFKIKPTLVSWSYGGLSTASYVSNYGQEKINGLVLVDSFISFNVESIKNHVSPQLMKISPSFMDTSTDKFNEAVLEYVKLAAEKDSLKPDVFYMIAGQALETTLESRKLMLSLCVNNDEKIKSFTKPLLLIWGEKDNHILITYCDYIKSLVPHAKVNKLAKCGHSPQFEKYNEFNNLLKIFCIEILC